MTTPSTIRVVIPLTVKRRNGRPRIVPPDDVADGGRCEQQRHVLRAIARAWRWRRMLELGEITTIQDIAVAEKVSDRFISSRLRLAAIWALSPDEAKAFVKEKIDSEGFAERTSEPRRLLQRQNSVSEAPSSLIARTCSIPVRSKHISYFQWVAKSGRPNRSPVYSRHVASMPTVGGRTGAQ